MPAPLIDSPFLLPILAFAALPIAWLALGQRRCARLAQQIALCATLLSIVFFATITLHYAVLPAYLDHLEPSVAAIGFAALHNGQSLFHAYGLAATYNLPYGPALYLLNALPVALLGPSIFSSKLAGIAALIAACSLLVLTLQKHGAPGRYACVSLLALLAIAMACDDAAYWNRPEPFLLLCVSFAIYSLAAPSRYTQYWFALACALAIDLKPHALLYFLPLLWPLYRLGGAKKLALSLALIPVLALLPYLLPQISLGNYIEVLKLTAHHPLIPAVLWDNLIFLGTLITPPIVMACVRLRSRHPASKQDWVYIATLAVAGLATALIGAKAGAGKHHLLPFAPLVLLIVARHWSALSTVRFGPILQVGLLTLVALNVASSIGIQLSVLDYLQHTQQQQISAARELEELIKRQEVDGMEMGYGSAGDYSATFARPLLVFAGQPYRMDAPALMDMQYAGTEMPPAWLHGLSQCQPRRWLLPHGKDYRFHMANYYAGTPPDFKGRKLMPLAYPLFSEPFRLAFQANYVKIRQGVVFDVYQCRNPN